MPKRKSSDCDRIKHKIKRLKKKLRHKQRRYSDDSESSSPSRSSHRSPLDNQDNPYMDYVVLTDEEFMLDENLEQPAPDPGPSTSRTENSVPTPSVVVVAQKPVDPEPSIGSGPTPTADPTATPATAAPTATPATEDPTATPATEDLGLDSELMDILGTDPTTDKKYGKDIQKDLSIRFQHWTTKGITKEQRNEFKERYLTPENSKLIDPPELNAEIKAAVSDIIAKRDKAIENKQKQLTTAITCLGEAITLILSTKEKNTALLKLLMDSARIICDSQHADTVTRRNFLLSAVKKEIREQLQNTKIDKLLFGENLAETLKSAKAINKSGTDLKQPAPKLPNKKPLQNTANTSNNLNWKNPGPIRRPTGPPRMKGPATTSTRGRPANSSKPYQHPQQRPSYSRR